jgi:hypothetical protein
MNEQFVIVKHGASFRVIQKKTDLQIKPVSHGYLSSSVCELVAKAQASIAKFYLISEKRKGNQSGSLVTFFKEKGWAVREMA